jgi:hypothetical protein
MSLIGSTWVSYFATRAEQQFYEWSRREGIKIENVHDPLAFLVGHWIKLRGTVRGRVSMPEEAVASLAEVYADTMAAGIQVTLSPALMAALRAFGGG